MTAVAVPELQPCLCLVTLVILSGPPATHRPPSGSSNLGGLEGMSSAWYGLSDLLLVERKIDGQILLARKRPRGNASRGGQLRMCCTMHAGANGERLGAPMRRLDGPIPHASVIILEAHLQQRNSVQMARGSWTAQPGHRPSSRVVVKQQGP